MNWHHESEAKETHYHHTCRLSKSLSSRNRSLRKHHHIVIKSSLRKQFQKHEVISLRSLTTSTAVSPLRHTKQSFLGVCVHAVITVLRKLKETNSDNEQSKKSKLRCLERNNGYCAPKSSRQREKKTPTNRYCTVRTCSTAFTTSIVRRVQFGTRTQTTADAGANGNGIVISRHITVYNSTQTQPIIVMLPTRTHRVHIRVILVCSNYQSQVLQDDWVLIAS